MGRRLNTIHIFISIGIVCLAACQPAAPLVNQPTSDSAALVQALTPIPTLVLRATQTATPTNSGLIQISSVLVSPTEPPVMSTETNAPSLTSASVVEVIPPTVAPTQAVPAATATLPRVDHYVLSRPFPRSETLVDYVDRTYAYGSTQGGARDVHLGVDYANVRHTPVLAVGAGTVIFAGVDSSTQVGPAYDYYGNTVIIKHEMAAPDGQPLYTLYGHLEKINVSLGQFVTAGDPIGTVGDSGIAIGPHLHLEVRVGGDGLDYRTTRNPDLWIAPYPGYGTLAGRVSSASGLPVAGQLVLIRTGTRTRETTTYGDRANGDIVWQENFALGDLPSGSYEVIISDNGNVRFRETVAVREGLTTFVDIALAD